MIYEIQYRYTSGNYGPWDKGDKIELSDADVDWLNRDAPGLLATVRAQAARRNRQVRRPAKTRRAKASEEDARIAEEAKEAAEAQGHGW